MNHLALTLTLILTLTTLATSSKPSIYDALTLNSLPTGLFPRGITNYTLNPITNLFVVHLNSSCNTKLDTSSINKFDWNFSGVLGKGYIGNLSGVSAKDLFLWFPVKEIRVDEMDQGLVCFDVGVVSKRFAVGLFESPRECLWDGDGEGVEVVVLKDRRARDQSENILKQHKEGGEQRATA